MPDYLLSDPLVLALTQRRYELGLSQERVAAQSGISRSRIAQYESGHRNVSLSAAQAWAVVLGCELALVKRGAPDD